MEVKVGIQHVSREVIVETPKSADEVLSDFQEALSGPVNEPGLLILQDERGRRVVIPVQNIAYVDLGYEGSRHVGFGSV
jgi:hypothetical protein